MNQGNQNVSEIQNLTDKLRTAKSLLIVLETDISSETTDSIHLDVVKVVHTILSEAQQIIANLQ